MKKTIFLILLCCVYQVCRSQCIVGNCKEGYGEKKYSDSKYCGFFSNNQRNGKGIYSWDSGSKYTGDFKDGMFHGYGVYKYTNGNIYEGEYKYDKKQGLGTLYNSSGNVLFAGEYNEDSKVVVSSSLSKDILADKYLLEAKKLMESASYKAAIVSFNKILALEVSPPNDFYYYIGKCHYKAQNYSRAITNLTKYLSITGKNGSYYTNSLELLSDAESKVNNEQQIFSEKKMEVKNCPVCNGTGYYNKEVTCSKCIGTGGNSAVCSQCGGNGQSSYKCNTCFGNGRISYTDANGKYASYDCANCVYGFLSCSKCNGKGVYDVDCNKCSGSGKVNKKTPCYKH